MKRIFFTAACLFSLLQGHTQTTDSTAFKSRKLKLDEINLVSSYYMQDGSNAAVTGGIGSQKLTDFANVIDVQWIRYDKQQRKQTLLAEVGIDHYTSASSDKIDLKANSSASHADTRIYPSLNFTSENEQKGITIGGGLSLSNEYDYNSLGANISFAKKTKDKNGEFTAKLQAYLDKVKLILPTELRPIVNGREEGAGSEARNSFAGSLSYSQVVNQSLQVMFLGDIIQQQGFLSLPFYRVYFKDGTVHQEKLPDSRSKLPLAIRANYFAGDKIIIKTYYRFYTDDWGLHSHTANIELPVKITPFFSISPFYRYYTQTAIKYFAPYQQHTAQEEYYSSNYDLSAFNSNFFGAGFRVAPPKGVFNSKHISMLELRYGHYQKNIDMNSDIISLNLKFK